MRSFHFLVAFGNFYFIPRLVRESLDPVFVVFLFSDFREHTATVSNRHSKLSIVGGIMVQPNLGGSKHELTSENASNRKS